MGIGFIEDLEHIPEGEKLEWLAGSLIGQHCVLGILLQRISERDEGLIISVANDLREIQDAKGAPSPVIQKGESQYYKATLRYLDNLQRPI